MSWAFEGENAFARAHTKYFQAYTCTGRVVCVHLANKPLTVWTVLCAAQGWHQSDCSNLCINAQVSHHSA